MAEKDLTIVAAAGGPSMIAGTEERAFQRFISVQGPFKIETVYFQQAAADDFKAADSFKSTLAHPLFCTVDTVQDIDGSAVSVSADLTSDESHANFKTIVINDAEGVDGLGILVTIYGY